MNREKKLIQNTGILAIGQLSSKVFTFLLLPVYTSLLTPEDYGTVDVLQTVISLALYIVTLQIECAVFRFIIENRDDCEEQCEYITSGMGILLIMTGISTFVIIIVNSFVKIPYLVLFICSIWAQAEYFFTSNIARGLGKNLDYSIASFIVTITSLVMNIFFIVILKMGAVSILLSVVISNVIGSGYYILKLKLWKFMKLTAFRKKKISTMLHYSLPLIPNAISWWIANTSDRIIIITFLGATYSGIYAAANKIPTIYTTIFSVFNLAWTESVSLAMKDSDHCKYINEIMNESYKLFSFINMGIILSISITFDLLIGKSYIEAYNQVYILLIAIFINSLCSLLGGILGGQKNSKAIGWTTIVGAVVNIVINIALINRIGLYAASISTLISYIVIYVCRKKEVEKGIKIQFSKRYSYQLLIMLMIVSMGYFMRILWINIIILLILIVWGYINNKKIVNTFLESIIMKKDRG